MTATAHQTRSRAGRGEISTEAMGPLAGAGIAGLAGALTVTLIHQVAKATIPETAPRMDILGRRAIAKGLRAAHLEPPETDTLQSMALAGDIVSNTLYYALVGLGGSRGAWLKGTLLGAVAGIGAVVLPPHLGLGSAPSRRTPQTKLMAFLWYLLGGLAAAGVVQALNVSRQQHR